MVFQVSDVDSTITADDQTTAAWASNIGYHNLGGSTCWMGDYIIRNFKRYDWLLPPISHRAHRFRRCGLSDIYSIPYLRLTMGEGEYASADRISHHSHHTGSACDYHTPTATNPKIRFQLFKHRPCEHGMSSKHPFLVGVRHILPPVAVSHGLTPQPSLV